MRQKDLAAMRFGAAAKAYLGSSVHATGADLKRLESLARGLSLPQALDLGCGAGHASYALAKGGAEVTACDLSDEMLALVEDEAELRGMEIRVRKCPAERLPFAEDSFDLAVTRYSAHHWSDVPAALRQLRRVLKPGGSLVVIDIVSPEEPLFDTVLQTVEFLRDSSHVRDHRVSEWTNMLAAAGFASPSVDLWTLEQNFDAWTARIRTPEPFANAAREVLSHAPEEARQHYNVRFSGQDCTFRLGAAWMRTAKLP
jgi:ubiquinone/menaquinone biosynthesis C-methylase UbiE